MKLIHLVRLSLVLTFIVVMLGAYTRLADAGLGCPDWPGCYGHLTVPNEHHEIALAKSLFPSLTVEEDKAWLEMIHRYFAGTLGMIVFAISLIAIKTRQLPIVLASALPVVVIFQALLGMWTVTMKLMPIVVMGHLLGGFTLFSLLAISHWNLQEHASDRLTGATDSGGLKLLAAMTLLVVIIQIALGGWTSSNYAALMCTTLPICEGNWSAYLDFTRAFELIQPKQESYEFGTLDYGARMTIHVTHRFGALVVTLLVASLAYQLLKTRLVDYRKVATSLLVMLALQISLGIANVLLSLPLVIAVAHNLGAAMLLIIVLRTNYLIWLSQSARTTSGALYSKENAHE
ncbi:COX15/CtaA family protein [Vibrio sinaloensis]|uniref:COX15/CtaA family protein n=1 Tax=Photobacterium sp. (strain ATCC 43367) TaxID=379097 RepID=UPI0022B01130|nr:COX15/CtaA family protein [Vibrio sinaloensis]MCZ4293473.1 COX15/CtaA family protein [Vibrio sinaloensis]